MVKFSDDRMSMTFAALADATRRDMLQRLSTSVCSVSELAAPFDMSLPAVMKHVRVLERAGLLTHEKLGRVRRCQLNAEPMRDAADWIARYRDFWTDQLDSLATYFESKKQSNAGDAKRPVKKASGEKSNAKKKGDSK